MKKEKYSFVDSIKVILSVDYIRNVAFFIVTILAVVSFVCGPFLINKSKAQLINGNYFSVSGFYINTNSILITFILLLLFSIYLLLFLRSTSLAWSNSQSVEILYKYSFFPKVLIDTSLIKKIHIIKEKRATQHIMNIYLLDRSNYRVNIKSDKYEECINHFEELNIEVYQK